MAQRLFNLFRRQSVAFNERAQPVRVLLALGGLMALCTAAGEPTAVTPLFLGVIASALAETDDSWQGRLRALSVTLVCFAAVAFAVEALSGSGWWLCAFLGLCAFCLTMMGAIEARYKSIGFATLALALYAVIGLEGQGAFGHARHREAALLLAGAAAYGLLSVVSLAAFPAQPVQAQLIRLFSVLGNYVRFKASLFEPRRDMDVESKRLSLAQLNASVVAELNAAKESLLRRAADTSLTGRLARYRGLYLIAQDVHERASSSHGDYKALASTFFHSDLLYRCQRVLAMEAQACAQLAASIARRVPFVKDSETTQALLELHGAIAHQRLQPATPERVALLASVDALAQNLARLDGQLAGASQPLADVGRQDMALSDTAPHSGREALGRVRRQLSRGSLLFRHALRLGVALTVAFAVKQWLHPAQGYWIVLTVCFVCQQNYGETVTKLVHRSAGTLAGVVTGWALLDLFPQPALQALLAVGAGVLFFATRVSRYFLATAAITVLVLMCFNRVGDSDILLLPRLVDTVIGSAIAWLAVLLVFPHWQSRRFSELAANALRGHAEYLRQIAAQYRGGVPDDLAYRIARRQAHDADAALSTAVVDMYREPARVRPHARVALRFLIQSHTLLNYLSALGAHRDAAVDEASASAFASASAAGAQALAMLSSAMLAGDVPGDSAGGARFEKLPPRAPDSLHLATEMNLIEMQIQALSGHAREWLELARQ